MRLPTIWKDDMNQTHIFAALGLAALILCAAGPADARPLDPRAHVRVDIRSMLVDPPSRPADLHLEQTRGERVQTLRLVGGALIAAGYVTGALQHWATGIEGAEDIVGQIVLVGVGTLLASFAGPLTLTPST